jgi:predicted DsbA family dithiol-disulfide isomerase
VTTIRIENFTDPLCPWAWSAEPALMTLRWRYGDAIEWTPRLVVLSERPEDYTKKGFTPDKLAAGMDMLQRRFGMPIDPHERPRMTASLPASQAVVGVRRHDVAAAERLLRRLRVLHMGGELIDEPDVLARAANEAGLDARRVRAWAREPETERELRADMDAARHPLPAALALDHKLAGWAEGRRYTCPSLVLHRAGQEPMALPGFQPVEAYDALVVNLAPELERRPAPRSVEELLEWAPWPLATREVAAVCEIDVEEARERLAEVAVEQPLGREAFWALPEQAQRLAA